MVSGRVHALPRRLARKFVRADLGQLDEESWMHEVPPLLCIQLLYQKLYLKLFDAQLNSLPMAKAKKDGLTDRGLTPQEQAQLDPHVRLALATWPQIDPAVEGIVTRIAKASRQLDAEMRASLAHVGLTKEEFKVLMELHAGPQTHGALCRHLEVSTGAMTNRLDKLERERLVTRSQDPNDRRGVLLTLTQAGADRLDAYIDRGAHRERELLEGLSAGDKRRLNELLTKLVDSLEYELDR
jgi:DNA-binding MarR family transcriptional regulator